MSEASSLKELAEAEAECRRCPLWRDATQAVPGAGRRNARLMLIGEQPGDKEDLAGEPFVGPAGAILNKAMADAGLSREEIFLTNSVKHFKHEQRGKRRLHKRPNAGEIDQCRWWLGLELRLVRPKLAVALGATAFRGVAGRPGRISDLRGRVLDDVCEVPVFVTVHPSFLLRIRDNRESAYRQFVRDLEACGRLAAQM
ncbi:UdgX family uracil-DNA binding protein [Roseibium salinum]|uniref:Type-4 uracil-DNA glycosylase n=1 Tax=Roseibium salinum TaxID=1604349 RepID=A0ABT3QXI9_9HYPH|nr:UdgX family uracil-DNA binding protein [Roseibium sp. DSM 29163]MCX2721556.1 UdgX family uracil-DNA binding protein [Roseibium sp. DSM 29163]MDN3722030.1 UdgX family uracil-DNA binding protein [Roseibium salinum]